MRLPEVDAPLVALCDDRGRLLEASGWLADGLRPGAVLGGLAAPESAGEALAFLLTLREDGAAFGTRLALAPEVGAAASGALGVAGIAAGDRLWVLGAQSEEALRELCAAWLEGAAESAFPPSRTERDRWATLLVAEAAKAAPAGGSEEDRGGSQRAVPAAAGELLRLVGRAGRALFREPLSGDQARLAAAVHRKSEAVLALLEGAKELPGEDNAGASPAESTLELLLLLEESVALHRLLAADREVAMTLSAQPPLGRPTADPAALELLLDPLLSTATELAEPGSVVDLAARSAPGKLHWELRLDASGEGAGEADWQASQKAVAALGGQLRIESGPGALLVVSVELPAG